MNYAKKTMIALLLCVMLLPGFASCGVGESVETVGSGADTTADTTVETESEPEETRAMHKVPESDFGGATFHTLSLDWQGYKFYFFADEATGDAMNDAIYDRRMRVEEYTNTVHTVEMEADVNALENRVKKAVQAGEDRYGQVLLHCIYSVASLSGGGFLRDYGTLPYVDVSAEWWNQRMMDVLRFGKGTYFGVSDYMIPCPYVIAFNRDMVAESGMDDPYALVYDGTWTLDAFSAMAEAAARDLDGDGRFTDADVYGVTAGEISKYISFMPSCGQYITEKGEDGQIRLALNTEKTQSIVEKLYAVVSKDGVLYTPASMDHVITDTLFMNGRLLFYLLPVSDIVHLRDAEITFGLLPYPKYDAAQAEYQSMDWGGLQCIPTTVQDPEMVGAVIELLAYESGETVIPAYYDVLLAGKLARDEDSVKMLDILFDTITYEIGGNYFGFSAGFGDLFFTLGRLVVEQKSTDFSSWYARNEKAANKTIEDYYKALREHES